MLGGEDVAGGACALSGMWGASTRQGEESGVQVVGWGNVAAQPSPEPEIEQAQHPNPDLGWH